jgi:hypothetical protein
MIQKWDPLQDKVPVTDSDRDRILKNMTPNCADGLN